MQNKKYLDLIVLFCCVLSVAMSTFESIYNVDSHHWGLLYGNASDLYHGLLPYRDIFIQYGYLTTALQGFGIAVLGDYIYTVGVVAGLFYAANIFLSYQIWLNFLSRAQACLAAVLMFLVHAYVIYPWPNYIAYTFFLLTVLLLVKNSDKKIAFILAGMFFAFSFLARHTSLTLTIVPIYVLFVWQWFHVDQPGRKKLYLKVGLFHVSAIAFLGSFFTYLYLNGVLYDWYLQTFVVMKTYYPLVKIDTFIKFFKGLLFIRSFEELDIRLFIYSSIFVTSVCLFFKMSWPFLMRLIKKKESEDGQIMGLNKAKITIVVFISFLTVMGYSQSVHYYEIYRLHSASSLGLGLLVLGLSSFYIKFSPLWKKAFMVVLGLALIHLATTTVFIATSSVYYPWKLDRFSGGEYVESEKITALKYKKLPPSALEYYENIYDVLDIYKDEFEVYLHYTLESYMLYLHKGYKRAQRSPFYSRRIERIIFKDEEKKYLNELHIGHYIIITDNPGHIPDNYKVIFSKTVPDSIPWLAGKETQISIPKSVEERELSL